MLAALRSRAVKTEVEDPCGELRRHVYLYLLVDGPKKLDTACDPLKSVLEGTETAYNELETDAAFSNSAFTLTSPPASLMVRFHGSKPFLLIVTV